MQCLFNRHGLLEVTAAPTASGGSQERPYGGMPGPAVSRRRVLDVIGEAVPRYADYAIPRHQSDFTAVAAALEAALPRITTSDEPIFLPAVEVRHVVHDRVESA